MSHIPVSKVIPLYGGKSMIITIYVTNKKRRRSSKEKRKNAKIYRTAQ